jgi:CO/xanthine dehydrogenase Mo-binding subunit
MNSEFHVTASKIPRQTALDEAPQSVGGRRAAAIPQVVAPSGTGLAPRSCRLADYRIPSATDFPRIRAISLQHRPSPTNPLGVKGAGEGGIIPVGGLMANAIGGALSSLGA